MKYDICIMVTDKSFVVIDLVIKKIRDFLDFSNNIVLIGRRDLQRKCESLGCIFIQEDCVYRTLSYDIVKNIIINRDRFAGNRTGWYLQQFLKCAYAFICNEEYYLVWDSDLIPLRNIEMFDDSGKPYFDIKKEYHKPYFRLIKKIFNEEVNKAGNYSFISEHMLIKADIMKEMLNKIEGNDKLVGSNFFEKIINTIRLVDLPYSGFSEFETYGNYVDTYHSDVYRKRKLMSLRDGDLFLRKHPSEEELKWASESYDLICMEGKNEQLHEVSYDFEEVMKKESLVDLARRYEDLLEFEYE